MPASNWTQRTALGSIPEADRGDLRSFSKAAVWRSIIDAKSERFFSSFWKAGSFLIEAVNSLHSQRISVEASGVKASRAAVKVSVSSVSAAGFIKKLDDGPDPVIGEGVVGAGDVGQDHVLGLRNAGRNGADQLDVALVDVGDDVGVDAGQVLGADVDVLRFVGGTLGRQVLVAGAFPAPLAFRPPDTGQGTVEGVGMALKGPETGRTRFLDGSHREWRGR